VWTSRSTRFPCGGGATTCESLWLGVPTLALSGSTFLRRAGLSLLTNLGLEELVTHSVEEYVRKAVSLGRESAEIVRLRQGLRDRLASSPITDAKRYARNVEALYPQCLDRVVRRLLMLKSLLAEFLRRLRPARTPEAAPAAAKIADAQHAIEEAFRVLARP